MSPPGIELDLYVENGERSKGMVKDFQGLTELEIVKLINKRKKRYCAMEFDHYAEVSENVAIQIMEGKK